MRYHRFLLVAAALTLAACTTYNKNYLPGMMIPGDIGMDRLTREDYTVVGQAEGKGCATFTALFPLPIWWIDDDSQVGELTGFSLYGIGLVNRAQASALYKAIESVPNADAMLSPRIAVAGDVAGLWHHKSCAIVKGKAIRIKTDAERNETPAKKPSAPAAPPAEAKPAGE